MAEYWLISAPGNNHSSGGGSTEDTFNTINAVCNKVDGSNCYRFSIPIQDLRVGTLDSLVELSDLLQKQDQYVESVVRKLVTYLIEVLDNPSTGVEDHLLVSNQVQYRQFLQNFHWEMAKYPTKQPLKDLLDLIVKEIGQIEADLKNKSQEYTALKTSIQTFERQQTGSLITRDLDSIVKKEHFVLGSEYLITVIVVIPNSLTNDWETTYETILDGKIVPRSSEKIYQDQDHSLYTCTLFAQHLDVFKSKCREKKFIVRNYEYDEEQMQKSKEKQKELASKKERQHRNLLPWLKVQFGEAFAGWLHVKALRLFVESVLRYGLPVNFVSALLLPKPKAQKRLRDLLNREFDQSGGGSLLEDIEMSRQFGFQAEEFYPYVYYPIKLDFYSSNIMLK